VAAHTRSYAIWVSEIMLQQTQVKTVIPYWNRWMRELPTIEAVANASAGKIHKLWEGLGYYTRVRNLQNAAKQIVECGVRSAECGNVKFPDTFEEVLALRALAATPPARFAASPSTSPRRFWTATSSAY